MTIGLPKALLYYRYGVLWETFFRGLGCDTVTSGDTHAAILENGTRDSVSECCLPSKIYMGHVRELLGRCDYILQPCFKHSSDNEKACIRFYGLYDTVKNTYRDARLLDYIMRADSPAHQYREFYRIGKCLGKRKNEILAAYLSAGEAQRLSDARASAEQNALLEKPGLKLLISSQAYVVYDAYIGGPIIRIVEELGAVPVLSDRCDRALCVQKAGEIAPRLYWEANMESIGAIAAYGDLVDGVILLTAFPCASDSLAGEMAVRAVKNVPVIQILVDGLMGEAGLRTRLESFIDIVSERKK